jgi:N-dimethylarginine dimethylaminohydrolase/prolyl-tRNA editing enzyme YbaK/EbsC (Cys-tRNA(Pro) deacylase)
MLINSTYDNLMVLLGASGARYRIIEHKGEGRTDIASALRSNALPQSAKSIVVRVSITKKRGEYLLAVIPGDKHVDLIKLSRLAGGTKAAFAARDVAERLTASVSGSIPPFSFNLDLKLIVDKGLLVHEEIFFNAARLDRSVALHLEDYLTLACPRVEHIATEMPGRMKSQPRRPINSRKELCTTNSRAPGRGARAAAVRTARHRRYLMCPPTFFDVTYSINPWMEPNKSVDADLAMEQWQRLHDLYLDFGHEVQLIEPVKGLPDMVFAANGATVVDGVVLLARFCHDERAGEAAAYREWFGVQGYQKVQEPELINEGEGDYRMTGRRILAGTGFRTDRRSHGEAQRIFGCPVISLKLVDPRFYHLDTALAVLDDNEIMYYPPAFSPSSRAVLRELYPDAIVATDLDAEVFGLNAMSDGRHVVLPQAATHLIGALQARGFEPVGVDVSELLKAGGGVKCCTLELHGAGRKRLS